MNNYKKNSMDLVYGTRVVFFGPTNHGKSSLMGYMYADANIDKNEMRRHINALKEDNPLCKDISPYVFSSFVSKKVPTEDTSEYGARYNTREYNIKDFLIPNDDYSVFISLIDTPGFNFKNSGGKQKNRLRNQEYGISKANIAIFCININDVNRKMELSDLSEMHKMWRAFHPNRKCIIAFTQCDTVAYSQKEYNDAIRRVIQYIPEKEIVSFVPVAIEFDSLQGVNILNKDKKIPWYTGKTLQEAIMERHFDLINNYVDLWHSPKTVFSIDKEIPNPRSNSGKVWRVFIENGSLSQGDKIHLTSVNVRRGVSHTAFAEIKEYRVDISLGDESEQAFAPKGAVITINLRNCSIDGKKREKKYIEKSDHTIGIDGNTDFRYYNRFRISLVNTVDILFFSQNQEMVVFLFGRALPVQIEEIDESTGSIIVKTNNNYVVAFPTDEDLLKINFFRKVVLRQSGKDNSYYSGFISPIIP